MTINEWKENTESKRSAITVAVEELDRLLYRLSAPLAIHCKVFFAHQIYAQAVFLGVMWESDMNLYLQRNQVYSSAK